MFAVLVRVHPVPVHIVSGRPRINSFYSAFEVLSAFCLVRSLPRLQDSAMCICVALSQPGEQFNLMYLMYHPFVWQNGLFVLGALGALAWVSMLHPS